MNVQELNQQLQKIYKEKLLSFLVFGSLSNQDSKTLEKKVSTLMVLSDLNMEILELASDVLQKWCKQGNPEPLFFSPHHFQDALDVFPLEYLDIKQRSKVLFGQHPLKEKAIPLGNLRHQCETELRGKKLHLRSLFASHKNDKELLLNALMGSLSSILLSFRGILHLLGEKPEDKNKELILQLAKCIECDPQIFLVLAECLETGNTKQIKKELRSTLHAYLTQLTTITRYVDTHSLT